MKIRNRARYNFDTSIKPAQNFLGHHGGFMQLIKQVNGETEEHLFRIEWKKTSMFGSPERREIPESNPYIKLTVRDKKYIFGTWKFSPSEWQSIKQNAESIPVKIGRSYTEGTEEEYFIYAYKGLFYLTEINMEVDDVLLTLKNLWQNKKDKLTRELERIRAKAEFEGGYRTPIPEDVQILVWNRDGGKCVKCGGTENLEFDHIIPLSKGGSNTARNIQLLCEHCNRGKGAKIGG